MSEPVYVGRLCTVRRVGKLLLRVEPATDALVYGYEELLVETQMRFAALLEAKA